MPAGKKSGQYTLHNKVRVVRGGADYFNCLEDIADKAVQSLHLQTYIFDGDETGMKVVAALIRAAARKVKVFLLLDGYASQKLPETAISQLKEAGVCFSFFEPFLKSRHFYIGRRLHHKVIVADGRYSMIAGINISNRYNDMGETRAWFDWAVYAEGEVAGKLNDICIKVWNRSALREKCEALPVPTFKLPAEECQVRIRRNDWVFRKTEITSSYRELFNSARTEVIMMTSYFWPPRKLLGRMAAASRRGVKIKLILTAIADVPFAKQAERWLYNWLFRNNIEVYEYQSNVLHGKLAVCDNKWLTAGSYNVNNISAYASVELNFDVNNTPIATKVSNDLKQIIDKECVRITSADFSARTTLINRLFYYLAYRIIHIVFFLFTFYFIQQRESDQ